MSHYDTLGVPRSADAHQIRAAYRRKAKKAHPDRQGGSERDMTAVNRAYAVLSDQTARARYDSTGSDSSAPTLEQQAQTALLSLVNQILDSTPDSQDLIALCRHSIAQQQAELKTKQRAAHQHIAALKRRRKRLKHEGPNNLIGDLIDSKLSNHEQTLLQLSQGLACSELALNMLKGYSYQADSTTMQIGGLYVSLT